MVREEEDGKQGGRHVGVGRQWRYCGGWNHVAEGVAEEFRFNGLGSLKL